LERKTSTDRTIFFPSPVPVNHLARIYRKGQKSNSASKNTELCLADAVTSVDGGVSLVDACGVCAGVVEGERAEVEEEEEEGSGLL
jgi:hypothetical protein